MPFCHSNFASVSPYCFIIILLAVSSIKWIVDTLDAGKKTEVSVRVRVIELPKSPEELVKKPTPAASLMVQPVR